jgi:hypothetical protein
MSMFQLVPVVPPVLQLRTIRMLRRTMQLRSIRNFTPLSHNLTFQR